MRRPFASLFGFSVLAFVAFRLPVATSGAVSSEQLTALFRPYVAEQLTLSPDGKHIAYSEQANQELSVIIMKLEPPYSKLRIAVADDEGVMFSKEKRPVALRYLAWATPTRLVFAPEARSIRSLAAGGPIINAPIMAVDVDGKNPRTLIDAKDLSVVLDGGPLPDPESGQALPATAIKYRTPEIMGFAAGDREHLLVQAGGFLEERVTNPTELHRVDIHTGKSSLVYTDEPASGYVYDRQAHGRLSVSVAGNALDRIINYRAPTGLNRWVPLATVLPSIDPKYLRGTVENYFGERVIPLGFDVDPNVLYVASNVGRDTFGIYAFNVATKQRMDFALEAPHADLAPLDPTYPSPQLVFDEYRGPLVGVRGPGPRPVSVWCDPELAAAQRALEKKFPQRTVEIREWSTDRSVFLLRVTGGTEPGRTFVYRQPENLVVEIMRRAPWLEAAALHPTEFFEFDTPAGVHLTGYLTTPRKPRLNPPPVAIVFADGFPAKPQAEFDREAQVLAAMGLVVVRLNHRGVGGFGRQHRDAISTGIDRVPVDDAVATLAWLAARRPIDRKRVAAVGSSFGGYLAVRATQLQPEVFRCAVTSFAPLNPAFWLRPVVNVDMDTRPIFRDEVLRTFLERGGSNLAALAVTAHPEQLVHPVFQIVAAGGGDAVEAANRQLRSQLKQVGDESDYVEVTEDYIAGLPAARRRVYERLEQFFNLALYDYKVKVGPTKEIK